MANGKVGDHPLTDILYHGEEVYSSKADDLVREIVKLTDEKGRRELGERSYRDYDPYMEPDVQKLERELSATRDRLRAAARDRGFELEGE